MITRRVYYEIKHNNQDITEKIAQNINNLTYTDIAAGEADDISIGLKNGKLELEKYQELNVKIGTINWDKDNSDYKLDCGTFLIDSVGLSGFPDNLELKAINAPINSDFMDGENTRTWKKASIRTIAFDVASKYGLQIFFDTSVNPIIEILEQNKQSDSSFLLEMLSRFGYCMKIYNNKLVIFREGEYEKNGIVTTINKNIMNSYSISDSSSKTNFSSATVEYKSGKNTKTYKYQSSNYSGKNLTVSETAENLNEAIFIAKAKLREENKKQLQLNFSMLGINRIVSTNCINIEGFGKYDGKYYIDKITHNFGNGYTSDFETHKVLEGDY